MWIFHLLHELVLEFATYMNLFIKDVKQIASFGYTFGLSIFIRLWVTGYSGTNCVSDWIICFCTSIFWKKILKQSLKYDNNETLKCYLPSGTRILVHFPTGSPAVYKLSASTDLGSGHQ